MDYARDYAKAVRYGREPLTETVQQLLAQIDMDPAHREPGSTLRLVLADALDENGRHDEAAHARSKYPMSVRDGRTQLSTLKLHRMLSQMRRYYGGEHIQGGDPTELRLEAAKELESIGRKHEAAILRSHHEICTHANRPFGQLLSHTVTGDFHRFSGDGAEVSYLTGDHGLLCHNCANGENGSEALNPEYRGDPQWTFQDTDYNLHYEGPSAYCDHCGRDIPSLYGDPDNENYEPEDDE